MDLTELMQVLTPHRISSIVFKAARRDVASHSFESTRQRLGDQKARQGDALPSQELEK